MTISNLSIRIPQQKTNNTKVGEICCIRLPLLENLFTQACNIDEVNSMTRNVIALMLVNPIESINLEFNFEPELDITSKSDLFGGAGRTRTDDDGIMSSGL